MKWLLILLILLAVVFYFVYRYRTHLKTAWFMYSTFRKMKSRAAEAQQQKQVPVRDTTGDTELLQCPKCGKWSAKEDAVKLKSNFYCSLDCLEETVAERKS